MWIASVLSIASELFVQLGVYMDEAIALVYRIFS